MNNHCHLHGYANGAYTLPPLGYDACALEPFLDEATVLQHHGQHHDAYVSGANNARKQLREIAHGARSIELTSSLTKALAFHLSGHLLHCVYWKSLAPMPHHTPEGELADAINEVFVNYEGFIRSFTQLANSLQGAGWVVLGIDMMSSKLCLHTIEQHQYGMSPCFVPLIACDLWEHAYYLRYHHNRSGYVNAFIQQLDWTFAQQQFTYCLSHVH